MNNEGDKGQLTMIALKSGSEIERIKKSGFVVADLLEGIQKRIEPGMTTEDIDVFINEILSGHDSAKPAFLGYRGFPKSICISLNDEVVHGIPSVHRKIEPGDVVSLDFGVYMGGYYGDAAVSFQVPPMNSEVTGFLRVCRDALEVGIEQTRVGNRVGHISSAIQEKVESNGFNVVRSLVGHGVGKNLHEEPQVPNHGSPADGVLLQEGMVLAIEPMINMGSADIKTLDDEWTVVTADGSLSAHFEHTVAVRKDGPQVLTANKD